MREIRTSIHSPAGFGQTDRSKQREKVHADTNYSPPPQRGFQSIPSPDVLAALVKRAVLASREGVYWDRGSILNIEI